MILDAHTLISKNINFSKGHFEWTLTLCFGFYIESITILTSTCKFVCVIFFLKLKYYIVFSDPNLILFHVALSLKKNFYFMVWRHSYLLTLSMWSHFVHSEKSITFWAVPIYNGDWVYLTFLMGYKSLLFLSCQPY